MLILMAEYAFKSGIVIFNYQRLFLKILGQLLKTITIIDIKSFVKHILRIYLARLSSRVTH